MKKLIFGMSVIGSLLGVFWTASASANLIVNGGFEEFDVGTHLGGDRKGSWRYYNANNVNGWEGDNLELWTGRNPAAYKGKYHAELNAHGSNGANSLAGSSWSIETTFETIVGKTYDLFFAYRARSGSKNGSSQEAFNVQLAGLSYDITDHVTNDWSNHESSFTAIGDSTTLRFTSINPKSVTVGNFLDGISVTAVPEPASLALLALGLAGIGVSRKKMKSAS